MENSDNYKPMILCFANKRHLIPANIFSKLVERKVPNITLFDDNKNPRLILSFDWIPLVLLIKSLIDPQKQISIHITGLHKRKGDIIQVVQSRMITDVNDYFESNFFNVNEFYILEGEIDTGPDLKRISRQNARRSSKRIPNSSRVKGFLRKDESYYNEKSEGYDLSSKSETESESTWLHEGFCDEKTDQNEDNDDDIY